MSGTQKFPSGARLPVLCGDLGTVSNMSRTSFIQNQRSIKPTGSPGRQWAAWKFQWDYAIGRRLRLKARLRRHCEHHRLRCEWNVGVSRVALIRLNEL